MDFTTLLGLAVAWGALAVATIWSGGRLAALVNLPGVLIVLGGALGATIGGLPFHHLAAAPHVLAQAFLGRPVNAAEVMHLMAGLIRRARREGVLAIEPEIRAVPNDFLRTGLQLVVDGTSQELLRELLETEMDAMRARHSAGQNVFATLGGFAPTFGMIGTVMGLIQALGSLERPEDIGKQIAVAFVTTLYGVMVANLICLPIANKLKAKSDEEFAAYQVAIEGLIALQSGESPRAAMARMRSYLPPRAKQRLETPQGETPA